MKSKDVKKLRMKLNMTQKEFANLVGCNEFTISRWECGTQNPRGLYLRELQSIKKNGR